MESENDDSFGFSPLGFIWGLAEDLYDMTREALQNRANQFAAKTQSLYRSADRFAHATQVAAVLAAGLYSESKQPQPRELFPPYGLNELGDKVTSFTLPALEPAHLDFADDVAVPYEIADAMRGPEARLYQAAQQELVHEDHIRSLRAKRLLHVQQSALERALEEPVVNHLPFNDEIITDAVDLETYRSIELAEQRANRESLLREQPRTIYQLILPESNAA